MSTFRTSFKILRARRLLVFIYLVVLSMLGLFTGLAVSNDANQKLSDAKATVAVIDHDGSSVSRGVTEYLESIGDMQVLEDSRRAMQDAIAQQRIDYILVIPEGFGVELEDSAREGSDVPTADTVIYRQSANGALTNMRVNTYLGQLHGYLCAGVVDSDQAVAMTSRSMAATSRAEFIATQTATMPEGMLLSSRMSLYPLFAFATVAIAIVMTSLNKRAVRSRLLASPATDRSRNLGLLGICLLIGLIGWAWMFGVGTAVFHGDQFASAVPLFGVMGLAMLSFSMVGVAFGFLLGQLNIQENGANAIANIGGMLLSFLGGAWLPIELLPSGIVALAKLTPGYWASEAMGKAYNADSTTWSELSGAVGNCMVCLLFAAVIACIALAVGRARTRTSSAA